MPNGAAGGNPTARADEPGSGECPARALLEWPRWPLASLASGMAGVQALDIAAAVDEGEQPAGARGGKAKRVREPLGSERGELAGRRGRAEDADRGGRMESALAQVGMAGPADRDHRLVAGDDRLHQRLPIAATRAS